MILILKDEKFQQKTKLSLNDSNGHFQMVKTQPLKLRIHYIGLAEDSIQARSGPRQTTGLGS